MKVSTTSIKRIAKGEYLITLNLENINGKYPRIRKKYSGDKPGAEEFAKELKESIENPPMKPCYTTLKDYLLEWLEDYKKQDISENTYRSYKQEINAYIAESSIGSMALSDIEPIHIKRFYAELKKNGRIFGEGGLSNRSVRYKHSILTQALQAAVDELKLIPSNPCKSIKPPRKKKHQEMQADHVILSKEQAQKFRRNCVGHKDYVLISVALLTGMRQSELLGLTWDKVDSKKKQISIYQTLHWDGDKKCFELRPTAKTDSSYRTIQVGQGVIDLLKEHKKSQAAYINSWNLVFPDQDGEPQKRYNVYHRFKNYASKQGFPDMDFHDLRHTNASIRLNDGELLNDVSRDLGHSDPHTTYQTYSHSMPQRQKENAERIEELLL